MKYSLIVRTAPRMLKAEDAGVYVGSPHLLKLMEEHGWIAAAVRGNRMTLFDVKKLDECCDRLNRGEFPGKE